MKFVFAISFCVLISVRLAIGAEKSISCYQCSSEFDPRCGDPFDPYTLGTVNCSIAPKPSKTVENITSTICRKTVQIVYGKTRITRSCGYLTDKSVDKDCVRRSGTHDVRVYYCSCTGDLCNASASLSISKLLVLIATAAGLLLNFYISALSKPY